MLIIIVLSIAVSLWGSNNELKFDLAREKSIPHISLGYGLTYSAAYKMYSGSIKGFVLLDNKDDQPKDLRQYYIIEAVIPGNSNNDQFFTLDEIIAMDPLPPKSLGKVILEIANDSDQILILEDEHGNQFFIDKVSYEVTMRDVTGDKTSLVTNESEYEDYWREIYK